MTRKFTIEEFRKACEPFYDGETRFSPRSINLVFQELTKPEWNAEIKQVVWSQDHEEFIEILEIPCGGFIKNCRPLNQTEVGKEWIPKDSMQ